MDSFFYKQRPMIAEPQYLLKSIKFEGDFLILEVNDLSLKFRLSDISKKLSHATDAQRMNYIVSPSGYGIHWPQLDEDLSINGLIQLAEK